MKQSNTYIIGFSIVCTIILGAMLSLAAVGLREKQAIAIDLDKKKQILGAVITLKEGDDVQSIYSKRIKSLVVDANGDEKQGVVAEKVDIGKNYKLAPEAREYPVFQFVSESNPNEVEAYILPVYGNGLWDRIWGYLAVGGDMASIKGIVFDHKAETPGLGARIADKEIQDRYVGKKLYDDKGVFMSVTMLKSEKGNTLDDYKVDGMSGATMTANGVNRMIKSYVSYYQPYLNKIKEKLTPKKEPVTPVVDSTQINVDTSKAVIDTINTVKTQ
ncbi:MAG: NADH:ubiquinone reductase (Na(+)-transporting) subunit C [Thermoflexibacter sp.]|nr:NADH:ubiquinone reductase (Na(+)-transporting) subunit C [Thermoflexibacter sp.]